MKLRILEAKTSKLFEFPNQVIITDYVVDFVVAENVIRLKWFLSSSIKQTDGLSYQQ